MYLVKKLFFTVAVSVAVSSISRADWYQWSGNGHWYQPVATASAISWNEAQSAAQLAGGYLATITSSGENTFAFDLVNSPEYWHFNVNQFMGPWLGATAPLSRSIPSSDWTWNTGEPWSYNAWNPGEPNNFAHLEDSLQFVSFPCTDFNNIQAVWNDLPGDPAVSTVEFGPETYVTGYIIESNVVPEPATILILAGIIPVFVRRVRQKAQSSASAS